MSSEQFQSEHAPDADRLDTVERQLDQHLQTRVHQIAENLTDYHLQILGDVPTDAQHRVHWMRGVVHLERHHLGIDHDRATPTTSTTNTPRERAETLARLEVVAIPRQSEPLHRSVEPDRRPDLFS